ncbi:glutamine--fructose-6-phosphate transaminase (isomerizing) [Haploplasma axanthum]|uniref:Glutamine--fructose-6-phosphate aminotransferase [isomerizing] n=1 Tax=Haploplasma axanthum TaxID=29552 RepID=A0A449BBW7_HAPAX|nr:glutamine--fructose-6-phosphate transaminase (isomerizing) [Haploplasma axanthum]VEU79928.1 Glucosamine--fructose-6-phosphate aminotransferase [isomerizing] [Haploplasma axanthum]
MCGIVGYIGKNKDAKKVVLEGLKKLEYRGYDSAGITVYNEEKSEYEIYKDFGRVQKIVDLTKDVAKTSVSIGHTRWATHGKVTKDNAHPHYSDTKRFIIVHNGVIENYEELKNIYLKDLKFYSETDTEVIAKLIEEFSKNRNTCDAIMDTLKLLKGSYALLVIDTLDSDTIYVAKNKSPLVIGRSNEGVTIASDLMALVGYANEFFSLPDHTFVVANENQVKMFNLNHEEQKVTYQEIDLDESSADMGEYQHYMLKEIYEQPSVIRRVIQNYLTDQKEIIKSELINEIKNSDRVYVLAAGTSMHAGYVGKALIEELVNIPVEVHIASEFAYHMPLLTKNPFFILVSQSGETADLRACLLNIKNKGFKTLTITNVKTSTLAREADFYLELFAGPEIAVASTKAYIAQIAVFAILANKIALNSIDIKSELNRVAVAIEIFLENQEISILAHEKLTKQNCFYIGRGLDYYTSLEAALKLKEISYIQTEGFAAGELKHGTIALIEDKTPVIALISNKDIALNTRSNLKETNARGAETIIITLESLKHKDDEIVLNDVNSFLAPMLMVVPTQLLAYYAALERGLDIDKPRNLAKSVTVE